MSFTACAHSPERAHSVTPLRMFGVNVDGDRLTKHEALADAAFKRHAGVSLAALSGWTVERRTDATWSEKHQRLTFTDDRCREGWVLWGCTLRQRLTVYIADENYGSANLAHEFCHALFPVAAHEDWPRLGCDAVEAEVRAAMTVPVLRVLR